MTATSFPVSGRSYYEATQGPRPDTSPLQGETHADVCVVGGGYTGLSTALHLARQGVRVAVLEQDTLGAGASGRNGGQVHVGMRRGQGWLERKLGRDDAMHLWTCALEAREHLDWLLSHYAIQCDMRPGYLHADHKRRHLAHSRANVSLLNERYDFPHIRYVEEEEMRARVATTDYYGGTLDTRGGHLHALNFALGIAAAAAAEGAMLHDHSRVTAISRCSGGWRVQSEQGAVIADRVVVACNGYLRGLLPEAEARVMPINNFVATTVPLGRERAEALIRDRVAVSDSRFVIYYFRITADDRLLFGGGESYTYRFPDRIDQTVRRHMLHVFPQLEEVPLEHAWGGRLAVTPNRLPYLRQVKPGLFAVAGYSGLGVVLAPYFGKLLAEALVGGSATFDRLTSLPVPRFPGGRLLRWPTLVAAMSFFALRDVL